MAKYEQVKSLGWFDPIRLPNPCYPAGRRCTEDRCITVLSKYNPGPKCYMHAERDMARRMSRAAAEAQAA